MNGYDRVVDGRIKSTLVRWKWLRVVQHTGTVGVALMLVLMGLALGKEAGWVPAVVVLVGATLGVWLALLAVVVIGLVVGASPVRREFAAEALERSHAPLLDRVNTLIALEREEDSPIAASFARRIGKQARAVLARSPVRSPFPLTRPLLHLLAFGILLLVTLRYYTEHRPWYAPPPPPPPAPPVVQAPPTLEVPPPSNVVEEETPWGEVRITHPGTDLAISKVEDVPLQIEAAANRPLQKVEWITAINGGEERVHALPPPSEPLFAAYQPVLRPEDLKLAEWDVVTYYARATTQKGEMYQSDVYFAEVRSFLSDLEQLPGGEQGPAYDLMNDLTGLIEKQQDIIRRTHQGQDAGETLAKAEDELAVGAEHLSARLITAFDEGAVRDPVQRLGQARKALAEASRALIAVPPTPALPSERQALAHLVAARKRVQAVLRQNPQALKSLRDEKSVQAPHPDEMLKRIAEFRDEQEAARALVQKTLDEQRKLEQSARTATPPKLRDLAANQEALRKALDDFRKEHPRPFEPSAQACEAACQAMGQAASQMKAGNLQGRNQAGDAARKLAALNESLKAQARPEALAEAHELKDLLDRQIEQLGRMEQAQQPPSREDAEQAARGASKTAQRLKTLAETPPSRDAFGDELRQALDAKNMNALESACQGLAEGQGEGRRRSAGKAKRQLEQIARAFDRSQRGGLADDAEGRGLKPSGDRALERGLEQLEALARRQAEGRPLPQGDEVRQRAEALAYIEAGIDSRFGHNERSRALLRMMRDEIQGRKEPVDERVLGKLREALQERRFEAATKDEKAKDDPKAVHLDPARLPPSYRAAIEAYFEKLSERP